MILDSKLRGTLDQGHGLLVLFEDEVQDDAYASALTVMDKLSTVVEGLSGKAAKLR